MTPLIWASMWGDRDIVTMLLQAGADPAAQDWTLQSALDAASDDVIFELIARAQFPIAETRDQLALAWLDRNFKTPYTPVERTSPLSRALSNLSVVGENTRSRGRVRIILSLDADPNERVGDGRAPLSFAMPRVAAVKLLLQHGADVNGRWCFNEFEHPQDAGCTVERGMTPLMWAAQARDTELVKLILQFNADRSLRDWRGRTALHYAITRDVYDLISGHSSTGISKN